ncbi:hypothetical protein VTN31DRAFT_6083 [Thermomyces dupontii]|uniref:uncharacterized protein n=1 Tax=Talaromyces thermophilus TaxID=28565 RepID=UPI003742CCC6
MTLRAKCGLLRPRSEKPRGYTQAIPFVGFPRQVEEDNRVAMQLLKLVFLRPLQAGAFYIALFERSSSGSSFCILDFAYRRGSAIYMPIVSVPSVRSLLGLLRLLGLSPVIVHIVGSRLSPMQTMCTTAVPTRSPNWFQANTPTFGTLGSGFIDCKFRFVLNWFLVH